MEKSNFTELHIVFAIKQSEHLHLRQNRHGQYRKQYHQGNIEKT